MSLFVIYFHPSNDVFPQGDKGIAPGLYGHIDLLFAIPAKCLEITAVLRLREDGGFSNKAHRVHRDCGSLHYAKECAPLL